MATFVKVGNRWRAQIRQKGHPATSKNFATKALAVQWARAMEADLDAGRARTEPPKPTTTVSELVDRYINEMSAAKPFGRNKADVLKKIKELLGPDVAGELTAERVVDYIRKDRGIRDVTATIDLTYLKGVLKIARALWREPVQPGVVDDAREILRYMGSLNRSGERDRRPTADELAGLRDWFGRHSLSLTPDVFDFILASCFRPPSEITRLRWEDLNHKDRTIIIHDRKDPRKKIGNHQTVPLLHGAYDIVMRQPQVSEFIFPVNGHSWSTFFPRACRDLKIEDLRLYDLRHEAISRLVESNKHSFPEMMLITGHKDPKQLMRYTQLRARDLHR
jgi:integrase